MNSSDPQPAPVAPEGRLTRAEVDRVCAAISKGDHAEAIAAYLWRLIDPLLDAEQRAGAAERGRDSEECVCGKEHRPTGMAGTDTITDPGAPKGPDCRPLTWREQYEKASKAGGERRNEAREFLHRAKQAEAEVESLKAERDEREHWAKAEQSMRLSAEARAEAAERKVKALRGALEEIANGRNGWLLLRHEMQTVARAALAEAQEVRRERS